MFCVSWATGHAVLSADDLWLGHHGPVDWSLPGSGRVTLQWPDVATQADHNFAALESIVDPRAGEVAYVGGAHRARVIGRLGSDGRSVLGGRAGELIDQLWPVMVGTLPALPWREVLVVRGDQDSPRAYAVPGAVVIGPAVDPNSVGGCLLYLVHELIHQWLGGMVRKPVDPEGAALLEAHVDAAAWEFVTARLPWTTPMYDRLFERYRMVDELQGQAELVCDLRTRLGAAVWSELPAFVGEPDPRRGRTFYDASLLTPGRYE